MRGDDELYIIVVVMITTMMVMMMKLGFSGYHAGGLEAILAKCAVEGNLYTLSYFQGLNERLVVYFSSDKIFTFV